MSHHLFIGGAYIEVQRSFVNASAAGNTVVVPAQGPGVRIRVIAFFIQTTPTSIVRFRSNNTDICPGMNFVAKGGIVVPSDNNGWFDTAENETLNVNLTSSGTVGVHVLWVPVK